MAVKGVVSSQRRGSSHKAHSSLVLWGATQKKDWIFETRDLTSLFLKWRTACPRTLVDFCPWTMKNFIPLRLLLEDSILGQHPYSRRSHCTMLFGWWACKSSEITFIRFIVGHYNNKRRKLWKDIWLLMFCYKTRILVCYWVVLALSGIPQYSHFSWNS